jgi:hypothetical protein
MPSNKYMIADKSKLLKTKLESIATKLQGSIESEELQTQEEYIFEAIKAIQSFYKDLTEPALGVEDVLTVREDDLPDPELYNRIWQLVLNDLITIFTELENIENLTLANFNFITTESNRLTARLKSVSSKLGDFILYSLNPNRDSLYFKDSFNDLSKVDVGTSLLNVEECDISQAEGIVTLPIDRTQDSIVKINETPIINPNSNGVAGNNQELGANFNGSLSVILDNNPDTWFEFENVVSTISDTQDPLVLDLTINLGSENVVNYIRINPNNFGTKTVIKIDKIETSIDGQVYTSIKDDIPIADFVEEDEENIFSLAPSTSKFAGQGIYSFTPRKVKYIHFVFRQAEPYVIETTVGQRLRYAIGIRDIDIRNWTYQSEGEFISLPFETTDEVRKVLLSSNQNPSQTSELAAIDWFVSPDNGATWHEIQPKEFTPTSQVVSTPEILEFNGPSANTINTSVPVNTLRVKAKLIRNNDAFVEGSSTFNKVVVTASETYKVPEESPFTIELEQPPVDDTVVVVDPLFGSRGIPEAPYIVGHATDGLDIRRFYLPFDRLPRPFKKVSDGGSPEKWSLEPKPASEWFHLSVGGEEWTQASAALSTYSADFEAGDIYRLYTLDVIRRIVQFGNSQNTLSPGSNEPIGIWMDAERLFPSEDDNNHIAQLDFHTSSNKDDFTIKRYDDVKNATEVLPRKATVIQLQHDNITDSTSIESIIGGMILAKTGNNGIRVTFLNGKDEFVVSGTDVPWSMDEEHGQIYLSTTTPDNSDVSVTYKHQPIYELSVDDWDWATTDVLRDSVSIKNSAWKSRTIEDEEIPATSGIRIFDLSQLSVEKGTLSLELTVSGVTLSTDDSQHPFKKEVDFIDGVVELGGEIVQTTETISKNITSSAGASTNQIISFSLKENISTDTDHSILFSNAGSVFNLANEIIFIDEQAFINGDTELTSNGDYSVDRNSASGTYGTVYTRVATGPSSPVTVEDPGTVSYFYTNPNFSPAGLYSVDYSMGRVYTQLQTDSGASGAWKIFATYDFTDFRAEYKIARLLDKSSYDIDVVDATITFKDSEILKYQQLPKGYVFDGPRYYLVNYDYVSTTREDIEDLQPSFSPVIKDFSLRVLTKGRLF